MDLRKVKTEKKEIKNLFESLNLFREIRSGGAYIHFEEIEVKEDDASYHIIVTGAVVKKSKDSPSNFQQVFSISKNGNSELELKFSVI